MEKAVPVLQKKEERSNKTEDEKAETCEKAKLQQREARKIEAEKRKKEFEANDTVGWTMTMDSVKKRLKRRKK